MLTSWREERCTSGDRSVVPVDIQVDVAGDVQNKTRLVFCIACLSDKRLLPTLAVAIVGADEVSREPPEFRIYDSETAGNLVDMDGDGDVDLTDFANWAGCMTGPDAGPYDSGCAAFDFDENGDVDLDDFAGFQSAFAGSP